MTLLLANRLIRDHLHLISHSAHDWPVERHFRAAYRECAPLLRNGTPRVSRNFTYVPIDFTHDRLDNVLLTVCLSGKGHGTDNRGELTEKAHKVITR